MEKHGNMSIRIFMHVVTTLLIGMTTCILTTAIFGNLDAIDISFLNITFALFVVGVVTGINHAKTERVLRLLMAQKSLDDALEH